ncbi:hypothetical protein M5K25_018791 [Dendrobium thyrsiflorum]|uniref:Uncharacterized protein n=1 Tax=Dendrobium thyrsiflorum TaxID=117978 RepID=A0ABD0UD68_DENTH
MEGSGQDHSVGDLSSETRKDRAADQHSSSSMVGGGYRLFDRQLSIHQVIGGGKVIFVSALLIVVRLEFNMMMTRFLLSVKRRVLFLVLYVDGLWATKGTCPDFCIPGSFFSGAF